VTTAAVAAVYYCLQVTLQHPMDVDEVTIDNPQMVAPYHLLFVHMISSVIGSSLMPSSFSSKWQAIAIAIQKLYLMDITPNQYSSIYEVEIESLFTYFYYWMQHEICLIELNGLSRRF